MKKLKPKTIVTAIDTSDVSQSMFKEALVLASSLRANIVVVSVAPEYEGNINRFFLKEANQQLREPFEKILDDAADYAASLGLEMTTVHRYGKPADEIVNVARQAGASLILLGSSKRFQFERMMLGRTIAEIIHDGPCDVLLMPKGSEIRFNKIMVDIHDSSTCKETGQRALDIAKSYGSEVHALFVIDIPTDRFLRYKVSQNAEQKATEVLNNYKAQCETQGVRSIIDKCWNLPEKCLLEYAQKKHIDLMVLSSKEDASMFETLWGSLVERVASKAVCPILVAKKQADHEGPISFLS